MLLVSAETSANASSAGGGVADPVDPVGVARLAGGYCPNSERAVLIVVGFPGPGVGRERVVRGLVTSSGGNTVRCCGATPTHTMAGMQHRREPYWLVANGRARCCNVCWQLDLRVISDVRSGLVADHSDPRFARCRGSATTSLRLRDSADAQVDSATSSKLTASESKPPAGANASAVSARRTSSAGGKLAAAKFETAQ